MKSQTNVSLEAFTHHVPAKFNLGNLSTSLLNLTLFEKQLKLNLI